MSRENEQSASSEKGFALVTVLLLAALLMSLLAGYFTLTYIEMATTRSTMSSWRGFYAAEAGLNIRAEAIRQRFLGYNRPSGTSPLESNGPLCEGSNLGGGDYRCLGHQLESRALSTYVVEPASNPSSIVVPRGEPYQNLHAQEYEYAVASVARGNGRVEAALEMQLKSRLVPLFQFAAFYNKDLEILPGPPMMLTGPVHSNGDLYLGAGASLLVRGQVTTAGDLYRGRKNEDTCAGGSVSVLDPTNPAALPACAGSRIQMADNQLGPWHGMIRTHVEHLTVPAPDQLDARPGAVYWDKADLRVVLDLDGATPAIEIRNPDNTVDVLGTAALGACGAAGHTTTFFNNREGKWIDMLDVDLEVLLDCAHDSNLLINGRALDDDTEGGLVFYLGVEGPDMDVVNDYGARVFNGEEIASTSAGAPAVRGLTVVTNQAIYVQGDYNSANKKPAAFMADSLNILSRAWNDGTSNQALANRIAAGTTINAAFLSGTDVTGSIEGAAGQDLGIYNGGLENYPRFHENWTGRTLTYRGSFVSLNAPLHVDGAWVYGGTNYTAPNRDWDYDAEFDDAANLPPLTPRFVYLKQELFVRQFEM